MFAIYKREMRSYFTTPTGYVFIVVFALASAFIFSLAVLQLQTSDVAMYYMILMYSYIILIPLLTMKSFSEEKRSKTEQLILTSPVGIVSVVFAKFFAALTMLAGSLALTLVYLIPLGKYAEDPNWGKVFGCLIGIILIGICFIAIGLFMSSLTENQFTAAVSTMAILAVLVVIAVINNIINVYAIRVVLDWISIYSRFSNFTYGIFDVPSCVYYLSVCAVFLFLTVRVFERRRIA